MLGFVLVAMAASVAASSASTSTSILSTALSASLPSSFLRSSNASIDELKIAKDRYYKAASSLSENDYFLGFQLSFEKSVTPNVISYGYVIPTWSGQVIEKQHQYVTFSYSTAGKKTFTIDVFVHTPNEKVLFHLSKDVPSDPIPYAKQIEQTFLVSHADKPFFLMFSCLADGVHNVSMDFKYKDKMTNLSFVKECGKISNQFLYIDMVNKDDTDKRTHIQYLNYSVSSDYTYSADCGSFDLELTTKTDAQLLLNPPKIDFANKTLQSELILLQYAEYRGNDKSGYGIHIKRSVESWMLIDPYPLMSGKVKYTLQFESAIFDRPISFHIEKQCDKDSLELPITNFTQFPLIIGTGHGLSDVVNLQSKSKYYNRTNPNHRVISEEQMAEKFYISVMKDQYGEELVNKELRLRNPIIEYDKTILEVVHDNPRLSQQFWRKPVDILLIFKCKAHGLSWVTMQLDFVYGKNTTQTISIEFMKECAEAMEEEQETSFLGDLFYYLLCFMAIFFGLYIIKLFKNLLQKESNEEPYTIDTTYKRKYDQMQELPISTPNVIL